MHFETRFLVTGTPEAVAMSLADVPLMASFLPGASVEPPNDEGLYPATLVASFGPKKLAFRGTLKNRVDAQAMTGVLDGQASSDVRGARMSVTMNYRVARLDAEQTEVLLDSQAQLSGVLAEFAKAGGVFVAEALIAEFARRFSAYLEARAAGETYEAPQNGAALSMTTVATAMLRKLKR